MAENNEGNNEESFGDKEFDDFLNKHSGEQSITPDCQKRLLFEIVAQKTDVLGNLFSTYADLYKIEPKRFKEPMEKVSGALDEAIAQLDYALCLVLDEMGEIDEEEEDGNLPPDGGKK